MKFVFGAVLVLVAAPAFCARHQSPAKAHTAAAVHAAAKTSHHTARNSKASSTARSGRRSTSHAAHASSSARGRRKGRYAARTRRRAAPSYQLQPTPDRYKEIQQALADRGYFSGAVDGQWGADSVDALKRFQMEHNAGDDGKINALSLIQLGLGPARDHLENSAPVPATSAFSPAAATPPPPVAAAVSNPSAPAEQAPLPLSQQ